MPLNARVLIKDQAALFQNGIYRVSVVGDGSTSWVLTRTTDYDTAAEIVPGSLTSILNGNTLTGSGWMQINIVAVVGASAIQFALLYYPPVAFFQVANNLSEGVGSTKRTNLGLGLADSPQFTGITISSLTTNSIVLSNGSSALSSLSLTNGQIVIGSTGVSPVASTITGTSNQVNVANGAGSITLSLPQSIATTSTPTFGSITLTNPLLATSGGTGFNTTTVGDLLTGNAGNTWAKVTGNITTTPMYLQQTGNGASSSAPIWVSGIAAGTITIADDATPATKVYPIWTSSTSGSATAKVTSTKLAFTPSTGIFSVDRINPVTSNLSIFKIDNPGTSTNTGAVTIESATGGITLNTASGKSVAVPQSLLVNTLTRTIATLDPFLRIVTTSATNPISDSSSYGSTAAGVLETKRAARGTEASPTALLSGDRIHTFSCSGYDGTNWIKNYEEYVITQPTLSLGSVPVAREVWSMLNGGALTKVQSLNTVGSYNFNFGITLGNPLSAGSGGTGMSTYTIGDMIYCVTTNSLAVITGNITTTRKFLRQVGSGSLANAPVWDTVTKTDVGLSAVENTALSTWPGTTNLTTIGAATATSLAVTGLLTAGNTTVSSWTPKIWDNVNTFGMTTQSGQYVRLGNIVWVFAQIIWANKGSATAGNNLFVNLPFTTAVTAGRMCASFGFTRGLTFNADSSATNSVLLNANCGASTSNLAFYTINSDGVSNIRQLLVSNAQTTGEIQYNIMIIV